MKKISVIFAACNRLDHTQQCVAMLQAFMKTGTYEIIAVDNGSTDGTRAWLAAQPNVHLLTNDENRGLAAAWNQAAIVAAGDIFFFLHNDVMLTRHAFDRMQDVLLSQDNIGAVGPYTNRPRYTHQFMGVETYTDIDSLQAATDELEQSGKPPLPQLFLEDFCLLMKREAYKAVGSFDEGFLYTGGADCDFSFRMLQAGYRLFAVPTYVHHGQGSYQANGWKRQAVHEENKAYFEKKWGFDPSYSTNSRYELLQGMDVMKKKLVVLDLGCACGGNLLYLRENNPSAELYGVELNAGSAAIAGCFADVSAMDVEKLERADWLGKFDYVIAADILEHLNHPWEAVRHIARLLKPGGKRIASLPNVMHISNIRNLLNGYWEYEDAGILDRTHLRFFTYRSICQMMEAADLQVTEMEKNTVPLSKPQKELMQHLLALPGIQLRQEELEAYQWRVTAARAEQREECRLDAQKICFITCVQDEDKYQQCLEYLQALEIPAGMQVEYRPIRGAASMTAGYQEAMLSSDAKYKIYLHQDVFIQHRRALCTIVEQFAQHPSYGIAGVIGCGVLPAEGIWWKSPQLLGGVYDNHLGTMKLYKHGGKERQCTKAAALDGILLATQYDVDWRTDVLTGWHFYDIAQCLEFQRRGYEVVVLPQRMPWCLHDCGQTPVFKGYGKAQLQFLSEYGEKP